MRCKRFLRSTCVLVCVCECVHVHEMCVCVYECVHVHEMCVCVCVCVVLGGQIYEVQKILTKHIWEGRCVECNCKKILTGHIWSSVSYVLSISERVIFIQNDACAPLFLAEPWQSNQSDDGRQELHRPGHTGCHQVGQGHKA